MVPSRMETAHEPSASKEPAKFGSPVDPTNEGVPLPDETGSNETISVEAEKPGEPVYKIARERFSTEPAQENYNQTLAQRAGNLDNILIGKAKLPAEVRSDLEVRRGLGNHFMEDLKTDQAPRRAEGKPAIAESTTGDEKVMKQVNGFRQRLLAGEPPERLFNEAMTEKGTTKLRALKTIGLRLLQLHHPREQGKAWQQLSESEKQTVRFGEIMVETALMGALARGKKKVSKQKAEAQANLLFSLTKSVDLPLAHRKRLQASALGMVEVYDKDKAERMRKELEERRVAKAFERSLQKTEMLEQRKRAAEAAKVAEKPPVAAVPPAEKVFGGEAAPANLPEAQSQPQAESAAVRGQKGREQAQAKQYINELKDGGKLREPYREQVKTLVLQALYEKGLADKAHKIYADKIEEQLQYAKFRSAQLTPGSIWNVPLRIRQLKHWVFEDFFTRTDALGADGWGQAGKERLRSIRAETVTAMREKAESILQRGDASNQEREQAYFLHGLADEYDLLTQNELYVERGYRETEGQLTGGVMGKVGRALRGAWKALKWLFGGGKRERQKLVQGRPAVGADIAQFLSQQENTQSAQAPEAAPQPPQIFSLTEAKAEAEKKPAWGENYKEAFSKLFEGQMELLGGETLSKDELKKLLDRQKRLQIRMWKELDIKDQRVVNKRHERLLEQNQEAAAQLLDAQKEWNIFDEYLVKEMSDLMEDRDRRYRELLDLYAENRSEESGAGESPAQAA